jgi:hypothetical protein
MRYVDVRLLMELRRLHPVVDRSMNDRPTNDWPMNDWPMDDRLVNDGPMDDRPVNDRLMDDLPVWMEFLVLYARYVPRRQGYARATPLDCSRRTVDDTGWRLVRRLVDDARAAHAVDQHLVPRTNFRASAGNDRPWIDDPRAADAVNREFARGTDLRPGSRLAWTTDVADGYFIQRADDRMRPDTSGNAMTIPHDVAERAAALAVDDIATVANNRNPLTTGRAVGSAH